MKIIVVAGAHSGVGKTLYAEKLLRALPDWAALKVTTVKRGGCPRGESGCEVCAGLKKDFEIVEDKRIIDQAGRDTARLKKAGAKKVIWLKATSKGLKSGLNKALAACKGLQGIVIEGTSVLKYIKPDLLIFVRGNNRNIRLSAKRVLKKADIVISFIDK
ncbi:MAG: hypothetical protein HQ593_07545 [Candidatus Omnitrophica bacterium]|nr:hypothetical protein [Candidatus Omnitrophota bacterium]